MPDKIKKDDLVCAFHEPFEKSMCRMKRRLDWLVLITVINALLAGANIILRLPNLIRGF